MLQWRNIVLYEKKAQVLKDFKKTFKYTSPNNLNQHLKIVQNKERIIIGCVYRLPPMDLSEFNNHYLTNLLDNLSIKNKTIVLLGHFSVDLLKYDKDHNVSDFLNTMY